MTADSQNSPASKPQVAVNQQLGTHPIFPWDTVVGVVDDADAVDTVVRELVAAGFTEDSVHVLAGDEGERLIDRSGTRHGFLGRVARKFQALGEEREHTDRHLEALRKGHFVVIVPTKDEDRIKKIQSILSAHGGHFVNYYTRMTTRSLAP